MHVFVVVAALALGQTRDDHENSLTRMVSLSGYKVKLFCEAVPTNVLDKQQYWGGGGRTPTEVKVLRLVASRRNQALHVPRSAYADLANMNRVWLEKAKGGVKLRIEGGDADVGYDSTLTFRGDRIVRRVVRDGEFPEYSYETTEYVTKTIPY
jgi:hypothetical protein